MTWIKVETNLPDKPEVYQIARTLGLSRSAIVGHLIRWWSWLDSNTTDGRCDGLTVTDIDEISQLPGLAAALASAGWLTLDAEGAPKSVPNFDKHNGATAKNRAQGAARQARHRQNLSHADVTTRPLPEKRRREIKRNALPITKPLHKAEAGPAPWRAFDSGNGAPRQPSSAAELAISQCKELLHSGSVHHTTPPSPPYADVASG